MEGQSRTAAKTLLKAKIDKAQINAAAGVPVPEAASGKTSPKK
jgi:hypothetical protein